MSVPTDGAAPHQIRALLVPSTSATVAVKMIPTNPERCTEQLTPARTDAPADTCRSVSNEDWSVVFIFGGEPDERGTYPRHAGIVAEDKGVCVYLSTLGGDTVVLGVERGQMPAVLRRIADFVEGEQS